jgi:hypothetical protein
METVAAYSVDLDACRQPHEPNVDRWDYVVVLRDRNDAIAIEPHPAAVLGDPEPRVPSDVALRVLLAITADMDLEHPVEPLALGADHPLVARDIVSV